MRFEIGRRGCVRFRRDILLSRLTVLFMLVMAIRPFCYIVHGRYAARGCGLFPAARRLRRAFLRCWKDTWLHKAEGKPSDAAILSARLIDRSIRSLFPEHMENDVHKSVHSMFGGSGAP